MSIEQKNTSFNSIYDSFFGRVTSDMYMELTEVDTFNMLQDLLINSIPRFEFPRFDVFDYEEGYKEEDTYCGVESNMEEVPAVLWIGGTFNMPLTQEEINILSLNMVIEWLNQQLTTTENTRMKFSGPDFKMTSQANHLQKLLTTLTECRRDSLHMQRLYKRRKIGTDGTYQSNWSVLRDINATK